MNDFKEPHLDGITSVVFIIGIILAVINIFLLMFKKLRPHSA